jgi:hypothetical protein
LTELPVSNAPLVSSPQLVSSAQLLSGIAVLLLVFVSGGVIYLSTIEWRDRRRRKAADGPVAVAKRAISKGVSSKPGDSKASSSKRAFAKPGNS